MASSGGPDNERFYLRNNVFRMTRYAFSAPSGSGWDEDYNFFFTSDSSRGMNYANDNCSTWACYRAASGQGVHSNRGDTSGKFKTEPGFSNPLGGILTLVTGSPLIDAGTPVPNISDRSGADYNGAAPDIGARER